MAGAPPYPDAAMRSRRRYINAAVKVSITDQASARSAVLGAGSIYTVYADCEWHCRQCNSAASATTSYMLLQPYQMIEEMYVSNSTVADADADGYVAGIATSGGSGTVYIVKVS